MILIKTMYTFNDYLNSKKLFESGDMKSSTAFKAVDKICKKYNVVLKVCVKHSYDDLPTIGMVNADKEFWQKVTINFDNTNKKNIADCFNIAITSLSESDPQTAFGFSQTIAAVAKCVDEVIKVCKTFDDTDYFID